MPNDRCALLWYPLGNPLRSRRTGLSPSGERRKWPMGGEAQGRFRRLGTDSTFTSLVTFL